MNETQAEEKKKKKFEDISPDFLCPVSSYGVHYFEFLPHGTGFIAICSRCLKIVPVPLPLPPP